MSTNSAIEWTEATWNPVAGCSLVSAGCTNCYAMKMAARLEAMGQAKYAGLTKKVNRLAVWTGKINLDEAALLQPLGWKKPRRIFVNSMSDLFHADVPFDFIDRVFAVMALTPQHTYQVLTKRPERMAEYLKERESYPLGIMRAAGAIHRDHPNTPTNWQTPLPNVWLGTSVENQAAADERIPHLLRCPAAVRFLSCEPLLGPVDLGDDFWESGNRVDWVIVGGESGPGARPMHPDWARSIRDQCEAAGVAFFFKQWGQWAPCTAAEYDAGEDPNRLFWGPDVRLDGWRTGNLPRTSEDIYADRPSSLDLTTMRRVGKKTAGRQLDGRTWDGFPQEAARA